MVREFSCNERKNLEEFLKTEFQANNVSFSELHEMEEHGWEGQMVAFETAVASFEIWISDGIWTVWVSPRGQWFVYSPSLEELSETFGNRIKLNKLCSILKVKVRKYVEV